MNNLSARIFLFKAAFIRTLAAKNAQQCLLLKGSEAIK